VFFNAGSNEQAFSPKSWKKIGVVPSCRFREKYKSRLTPMHSISKKMT